MNNNNYLLKRKTFLFHLSWLQIPSTLICKVFLPGHLKNLGFMDLQWFSCLSPMGRKLPMVMTHTLPQDSDDEYSRKDNTLAQIPSYFSQCSGIYNFCLHNDPPPLVVTAPWFSFQDPWQCPHLPLLPGN